MGADKFLSHPSRLAYVKVACPLHIYLQDYLNPATLSHLLPDGDISVFLSLKSRIVPFWEFLKIFLQNPVTRLRVTAFLCVARM